MLTKGEGGPGASASLQTSTTERTPLLVDGAGYGGSSSCCSGGACSKADDASPPAPFRPTMARVSSSHKLWEGWGDYSQQIEVEEAELRTVVLGLERDKEKHGELLGEWRASSICSNGALVCGVQAARLMPIRFSIQPHAFIHIADILSSCFYTIGLVTSYSGKMVRVCVPIDSGCDYYVCQTTNHFPGSQSLTY